MVEGGDVERVFLGEGDGGREAGGRVAVVAEDERAVDADTVAAEVGEGLFESAARGVERLVHRREVGGVEALEADEDALAAAAHEEIEEFVVVGGVDAGLADPADVQRDEGAEKIFGLGEVGGDVVVDEEEEFFLALEGGEFGEDIDGGTAGLGGGEDGLHGAELAVEVAAATGLDEADGEVAFAAEDGAVGAEPDERRAGGLAVEFFEAAVAGVVEDAGPEDFGFAADDGLGVAGDLVGAERGVEAAHDDGHAAAAIVGGDLVGALGGVGFDAEGDEVGGLVERDRLHAVVVKPDLDVARGEAGEGGGGERLHLPSADVAAVAAAASDARMDDRDSHTRRGGAHAGATGADAAGARREGARPMIQSQL